LGIAVLFVCLGNICRSPLAEAAFRKRADEAGLEVKVDSAGTGAWHKGQPPDRRSIAEAARRGIDISSQRARQVRAGDFSAFDHIIGMDADNLRDLRAIMPEGSTARLALVLDFAIGREGQSVADPYYGGDADFARTWEDVDRGAAGLVDWLMANGD
jgi:protein-tyrosine phosphatase